MPRDPGGLTGTWLSHEYACPWGTKHTEIVTIIQAGDEVFGTKVTGDDCVPVGCRTFSGRLADAETGLIQVQWVVGTPGSPVSGYHPGWLRVINSELILAGAPGWRDMRFTRVGVDRGSGHDATAQDPPLP